MSDAGQLHSDVVIASESVVVYISDNLAISPVYIIIIIIFIKGARIDWLLQ